MRTVKKNVYYCEHCKKHGLSAPHIARHEKGCTNNLTRVCGMCRAGELDQQPIESLLVCLPDCPDPALQLWPDSSPEHEQYMGQLQRLEDGMEALRELCQQCPACIAAALRQKNIPWHAANFDFQDECADFWKAVNDANATGSH